MKKLIIFLLLLTLLTSTVGCFSGTNNQENSSSLDTANPSENNKPKRNPNLTPVARLGYQAYCGIYPQQSLESYAEAYKMEHRIFLCDIRLTSDQKIVCVHDDDISKVGAQHADGTQLKENEVLISETSLENLLKYDFSTGKGTVKPLQVLQLEDFMEFCTQYTDVTPCLEFKVDMNSSQVDKIVEIIKEYGYEENVMLVTPHSNAQLLAPRLPKAIIGRWVTVVNDQVIEEMASYGTKAFVYLGKEGDITSINPETYSKAQTLGVDLGFSYISSENRDLFDEIKSRGILNLCKYIAIDDISWLY